MKIYDNDRREFKQKLEYLKFSVDPVNLLTSLGFTISKESDKEIRANCVIHGGDNKTAFRFNKEFRTWACFTHKCHRVIGHDIISLIRAVKGFTFIESVTYLQQLVGDVGHNISLALEYERKKERKSFITSMSSTIEKPAIVDEEKLKYYKPFRSESFNSDGFTDATLDHFEVAGGYVDSFGYLRDIIPIRNAKGELVAYSMRDIRRDVADKDFKYVLTKGFAKDKVLYNLHNAKQYISPDKSRLIIVEGFKSVWRMYDLGIYNVVAVMGSELTPGQINLLFTHGISNVVIFFDGDVAGILGAIKTYEALKGKITCVPIFISEEGKDPSDLSDDQIYNYLRGYY